VCPFKVVLICIVIAGCTSKPFWTPRAGPVPPRDDRHAVLGTWRVEFTTDTVESLSRNSHRQIERLTRRGVTPVTVVGTLQLLDSLTKDRYGVYALIDSGFEQRLCPPDNPREVLPKEQALVIVNLTRKAGSIEFFTPYVLPADAIYVENLFAKGRFYGDSVVGQWFEQCSENAREAGRLRMERLQ